MIQVVQVTSYWKTGNRIHKVKVFIANALRMTVPQTKQHFIDKNSSTMVGMLAYWAGKKAQLSSYTSERSSCTGTF